MTFVTLKLYQGDGTTLIGELPSFKQVQPLITLNDVGAANLSYPVNGIRADQLDQGAEREIAVLIDGVERARYLLEDDGRSEIDTDLNKAVLTISGREVSQLLDRAKVFPVNGIGTNPPNYPFTTATPGTIINTLITAAQGRGALTGWTTDFTGTVDSDGVAWGSTVTFAYKPSSSVLDVLKHLSQTLGLIDWKVVGRTLHVYKANTFMAQDRTNAIFSRGRDLTKAEFYRTKRDIVNAMIVEGDDSAMVLRTDNTSISARGRYEGYFSQSGVTDPGTLNVVGDLQLSFRAAPRIARPISVQFRDKTPKPFTDFSIGDFVYLEEDPDRVVQMSLTLDSSAVLKGDLDLNDKFDLREVIAERKLNALSGIVGQGAVVGQNTNTPDATIPSAPLAPGFTSDSYLSVSDVMAQISITWAAVTTNTDSSTINDLDHYEVQFRYSTDDPSTGWKVIGNTSQTFLNYSPVLTNRSIVIRVRAWDSNGHASAWSPETTGSTAADTVAPPVPSTPVLDVVSLPLLARTSWDGKDNGGASEAGIGNFSYIEVHASSVSGFTPTSATLKTTVNSQTLFPIEWPANMAIFVKFIAVSRSGIKSSPSAQATAVVRQAQDGEIVSITASKITAGVIGSDIVVSGRFATALTGDRREMNNNGFQAWDASETLTISLDGVSNLLTGIFKTALTGTRIEIGAGGDTGEIVFYGTGSTQGKVVGSTFSGFGDINMLAPISGLSESWNAIGLLGAGVELAYFNSGSHQVVFNGDSGGWAVYDTNNAGRGTTGGGIGSASPRISLVRGSFSVFDAKSPIDGSAGPTRIFLDSSGSTMWGPDGTAQASINLNSDTNVYFRWKDNSTARAVFLDSPRSDTSARLQLVQPQNFGTLFKFLCTTSGTSARLQIMDTTETVYLDVWAGAFTVGSTRDLKNSIKGAPVGALERIKTLKPRQYRRKGAVSTDRKMKAPDGQLEIGLVVDETYEHIQTLDEITGKPVGINMYALAVEQLAAIQELAEKVDRLSN